ncbi:MAG TPA: efflux RND transporter permease subunit, partial [Rhizobiaceae bacterium]|nr:efflux RND transporter permease subunit [Rhizobiaceae bacterium]
LTLLALVLATGMVVDDAIVVLENIVTQRNRGLGSRAAAVVGTREVFFAVITTTATLAAVFIPISFLPGKAGGLFREFGFVLAISVALSSVVALSLCPMLASRFLSNKTSTSHGGLFGMIGRGGIAVYRVFLRMSLSAPMVLVAASIAFGIAAWLAFPSIRKELTPPEDRAVALMSISAPQGVSLDYTTGQLRQIEALIEPLRQGGEIRNVFAISGRGGSSNSAFMVMTLAPWEERKRTQQEIVGDINRLVSGVPGVRAFAIQPNSLGIRGAGSGLQIALAGDDYDTLAVAGDKLVEEMEKDPRFGRVRMSYETTQPQLSIAIDRERASDLGVPIDGLAAVIQAMLDGRSIGSVFVQDKAVSVKLVSTLNPINDPTDLENIFLRASDGRIVPMSSISTLQEKAVAPSLSREQKLRAVSVTASLTPDFALQSALDRATEIVTPLLPPGARVIPLSEAATLEETSGGMGRTFAFAIIVVLLVLAAQFESFVSSLIIMATVPIGLACAIFALILTGTSLNVYSQIGLVLLVGIMAKNGILIVEFANQLRDRGYNVRQAIEEASVRRLRPVMMTMISTVLGGLPLVLASGAGAEARIALGWVIVGGLGLATFATLFLTPVAYLIFARFSKPKIVEERRLAEEMAAAGA